MATDNLVLLHGFMGAGADWQPVCSQLATPAVNPDLPWHGSQVDVRPTSWAELLDKVAETLPSQLHLVGYSFGARIALGLAATRPERVLSLTLVSGNPGIPEATARAARIEADEALATRLDHQPLPQFLDWWYGLELFCGLASQPASRRQLVERRSSNDAAALADCLRIAGTGRMPDYRPQLAESAIPLHYLAGERDDKYCALATELQQLRPDATVTIIPNASHALVQEVPATVAAAINAFYDHRR